MHILNSCFGVAIRMASWRRVNAIFMVSKMWCLCRIVVILIVFLFLIVSLGSVFSSCRSDLGSETPKQLMLAYLHNNYIFSFLLLNPHSIINPLILNLNNVSINNIIQFIRNSLLLFLHYYKYLQFYPTSSLILISHYLVLHLDIINDEESNLYLISFYYFVLLLIEYDVYSFSIKI